uniref:Uncharacterized protein n=1 Tax=Amphimedon queenslandica TaxID=400682 RepID=A0A1X7V9C4_AMPQE
MHNSTRYNKANLKNCIFDSKKQIKDSVTLSEVPPYIKLTTNKEYRKVTMSSRRSRRREQSKTIETLNMASQKGKEKEKRKKRKRKREEEKKEKKKRRGKKGKQKTNKQEKIKYSHNYDLLLHSMKIFLTLMSK